MMWFCLCAVFWSCTSWSYEHGAVKHAKGVVWLVLLFLRAGKCAIQGWECEFGVADTALQVEKYHPVYWAQGGRVGGRLLFKSGTPYQSHNAS